MAIILAILILPITLITLSVKSVIVRYFTRKQRVSCIERIVSLTLRNRDVSDKEIGELQSRYSNSTLFDSLLTISQTLYGELLYRIALVIEMCDLEGYILRMIISKDLTRRHYILSSLACLPLSYRTTEVMTRLLRYGDRSERFYALTTLIANQPQATIKLIAEYPLPLSLYEVATLFSHIRRRGYAIPYSPLLSSENRNLQLLGIYMVQHFELCDCEEYLHQIIGNNDRELSLAALYALGTIGGDITRTDVMGALLTMNHHQRSDFIGALVQWRYPLEMCHLLLNRDECVEFQQRINSYKTTILCN